MKKFVSIFAALVLMASASLSSFAAITSGDDSTAKLEFTAGQLVINPGDPDPTMPTIKGREMNFGSHEITGSGGTYDTVGNEPAGVIVTDARGGQGAQWNVSVRISEFKDAASAESLQGFELELKSNSASLVGPANGTNEPEVKTITINKTNPGEKLFVANATNGSAGKWGANWDPKLSVLGGTETVSDHTATVTWSVSDTL